MDKLKQKERRKKSVRKKVSGTVDRPRMAVHKSNKNIYVQVIDDITGKTICGASTKTGGSKTSAKGTTKTSTKHAEALGGRIAEAAIGKGVKKIVFDRGGYKYHGAVKALAEGARKAGLEF
ncbi:MAG TPA: 50S ribosomal protein L18 [Candidatus Omnitrophota bacterium]|nr:50S ribosomal protein L18 [Candidatus Omnitrophota bacterium]